MIDIGEMLFNALIFINIYSYSILILFVPCFYYIITKFFVFPLAPNQPHEFIIMAKPEQIKIKKVINRYLPFFQYKNGLYWFDTPCNDIESGNQYHIFAEGINQNITSMERRKGKVNDLAHNKKTIPQIGPHVVRIPKRLRMHLHKHYQLIIDPKTNESELLPVHEKQPFKINYYHTLGILMKTESEEQTEELLENSGGTQLIALTNQTVIQQINFVQEYNYFSANYAFNLWKHIKKIEFNFMTWVTGSIDPKIIAILLSMGIICVLIYISFTLMSPEHILGPMPE